LEGARTPNRLFKEGLWDADKESLTKLGETQMKELGIYLKNKYIV